MLLLDACNSAPEARAALVARPPQVAVVASPLGAVEGAVLVAELAPQLPETAFIIVGPQPEGVLRALRSGAVGYLLESEEPATLLGAIVEAQLGGAPITRRAARLVVRSFVEPASGAVGRAEALSRREHEVLAALADGLTYEGVAVRLGISADTVRAHVRGLYRKLGVRSREEAVARFGELHALRLSSAPFEAPRGMLA